MGRHTERHCHQPRLPTSVHNPHFSRLHEPLALKRAPGTLAKPRRGRGPPPPPKHKNNRVANQHRPRRGVPLARSWREENERINAANEKLNAAVKQECKDNEKLNATLRHEREENERLNAANEKLNAKLLPMKSSQKRADAAS